MNETLRIKNLQVPISKIDVVLDTDAYNEIDDQYAIAYLLKSKEKLNTKAIYAAPFSRAGSGSPEDGMEKSYVEILKLLSILGEEVPVFRGAKEYLKDEKTPVLSPAAYELAERANAYSSENPLYVVAIGAITNVASAILLNPKMIENTVIIWLGGHAYHYENSIEFNLKQDIAAARVVFSSGVPFVQLPCKGVVSQFTISKPDLNEWLIGKNPLTDYLANITIEHVEKYDKNPYWSKVIWDVTAVAWLLNDNEKFMKSRLVTAPIPSYDGHYTIVPYNHLINYVYFINRDILMADLIKKLMAN
jgi:inosine-uridine nucleoside N-ribohydrolase